MYPWTCSYLSCIVGIHNVGARLDIGVRLNGEDWLVACIDSWLACGRDSRVATVAGGRVISVDGGWDFIRHVLRGRESCNDQCEYQKLEHVRLSVDLGWFVRLVNAVVVLGHRLAGCVSR